jgi:arabinogalactan oligomer/maltooligosaccharide transport system substrate-binding protein
MCDKFNELHPEWDITFKYGVCSEGDAKTNLTNDPASGADVYMYANDQIPDLVTAGAVAELGGSVLEAIKAANSETTVATVTYEDAVYGVPFTGNTWFMYYNKDVFTEDDVKNLDTMLKKGKVSFPLNNSWYFASFYAANGGTLFGEDGTDKEAGIQLAGDNGAAVTKYLVNLVKNKNFTNDANGSGLSGFGDGSIGAFFSGTWDYNNALEALGGDESKLGICAPPTVTIDGKECQMKSFAGSKAIGVNPHSANMQVAVALAAYLGGTDAQKAHLELRNIIPTDNGVDVGENALAKAQMDTMAYGSIVQPVLPEMSRYWDPASAMANELLDKKVTEDNAAEKTEAMNDSMNSSVVE